MNRTASSSGSGRERPGRERGSRERSAEVLDAARALFFERGYRATTVQQIAQRAGYSKRTVYLDYLNKDELFITVCAEGGQVLLEQLQAVPVAELTAPEAIDRFVEAYVRFSQRHRAYFRMIFNEASAEIIDNCSAELRQRVAELERSCVGVVVEWAERAAADGLIDPGDPWETAGILTGAATGIIVLSMGGAQTVFSPQTRQALVRKAVKTMWRGLAPLSSGEAASQEPARRTNPSRSRRSGDGPRRGEG